VGVVEVALSFVCDVLHQLLEVLGVLSKLENLGDLLATGEGAGLVVDGVLVRRLLRLIGKLVEAVGSAVVAGLGLLGEGGRSAV
jgi:hypothetical protein